MTKPEITTTRTEYRIDVECQGCKDGVNASTSAFGEAVTSGWADAHKCQAPRKAKR